MVEGLRVGDGMVWYAWNQLMIHGKRRTMFSSCILHILQTSERHVAVGRRQGEKWKRSPLRVTSAQENEGKRKKGHQKACNGPTVTVTLLLIHSNQ
ncbi:hypothetical protein PRUPE_6G210100 [Prunus persica]|uniref:Uncharacterized protein n=1 Tax=Prunus persica TaxID=3760 RepID=A0A251NTN3_PRUPE|nr:hypothetical protein PRUPE_6G210100 [Prunus persica]